MLREEEEAERHSQRNVITLAIGTPDVIDPDVYEVALDGDIRLPGSDGLATAVDDDEIEHMVTGASNLESAGERLIVRANENGGPIT